MISEIEAFRQQSIESIKLSGAEAAGFQKKSATILGGMSPWCAMVEMD